MKSSRPPSRSPTLAAALLLAVFAAVCTFCRAGDSPSLESKVKAACILNFIRFTEWPQADAKTEIVVGLLGDDPYEGALEQMLSGQNVGGRKIVVRHYGSSEEVKAAQVIVVGITDDKTSQEALAQLKNQPTLTIGESSGFLDEGGMIRLLKEDGKVRFEINTSPAKISHLTISSKLLSLAKGYHPKGD